MFDMFNMFHFLKGSFDLGKDDRVFILLRSGGK